MNKKNDDPPSVRALKPLLAQLVLDHLGVHYPSLEQYDREQIEWLEWILEDYGAGFQYPSDDPRVGDLAKQADDIERVAAGLAELIDRYAGALHSYVDMMPSPLTHKLIRNSANIRDNLRELSQLAGQSRAEVIDAFGSGDPDQPDPGGRGGIRTRLWGNDRKQFADELASTWNCFKGRPSGTAGGPFHRFVLAAHEHVVGKEASGFEREVKAAAKEYNARQDAWWKVEDRIEKLRKSAYCFRLFEQKPDVAKRLERRVSRLMDWRVSRHFPAYRRGLFANPTLHPPAN